MKQKISLLLAALLLVCLLTGCSLVTEVKGVKEAIDAIDAIGTVTIDSLADIEHAESLYDALEGGQDWVENADVLTSARKKYDGLVALIKEAEDALDAIRVITPASGPDLEAAYEAFEVLEDEDLTDEVDDFEEILAAQQAEYDRQLGLIAAYEESAAAITNVTLDSMAAIKAAEAAYNTLAAEKLEQYVSADPIANAKAQYEELYLQNCYDYIMYLYKAEGYSETIAAIADLYNERPGHKYANELAVLAARCNITLAQSAYYQDDLETALYYLNQAANNGSDIPEYTSLQQQIQTQLESLRPANGKYLHKKVGAGYSSLTVKTYDYDACVKVEAVDNPKKYTMFYIRANSEFTISIATGKYYFKYTTGDHWFGDSKMFGSGASFVQADQPLDFSLRYSGNYVYYHKQTITLGTVGSGNFGTSYIDPGKF